MADVMREVELYPGMCEWLDIHLRHVYKKQKCKIIVTDCHSEYLDNVLNKNDILQHYPQTIGLKIQIDVLGMVIWDHQAKIFFIEAKKSQLNLQHVGQILVYCKLCNPEDAFLLSSAGIGSLDKVLRHQRREDLLEFGSGKNVKKIKVAKWSVSRKTIDQHSIIPKIT